MPKNNRPPVEPVGGKVEGADRKVRKQKGKPAGARDKPVLEENAAGIDVGAREIYVAVPADRDDEPVRSYATFTGDLAEMAKWLLGSGITTAALESTGVYWIPVYDALEAAGIRVCLVDARGMRNVPGKRTDWHECQWIQYLHSVGLLRAAFRPEAAVRAVRTVARHRDELVAMASQHVQHMQKAMTQMNVQLHNVISDITGQTGLAIVDAILEGQRDPAKLAELRNPHIKASVETIRKSLEGNWRPEHLFTLGQSRRMFGLYREQVAACEAEIERLVTGFPPRVDPGVKPPPPDRKAKAGTKAAGGCPAKARQRESARLPKRTGRLAGSTTGWSRTSFSGWT